MTAAAREHTSAALGSWVRALSLTAAIGSQPSDTLPLRLDRFAERFGAALALRSTHGQLSFEQLALRAYRYARWGHAQGWRRGDVVALLMHNSPEYLAIWLGLTRLGLSVALVNTHLRGAGLEHSLYIVNARAVLVGAELANALAELHPRLPAIQHCWIYGAGGHVLPRLDVEVEQADARALAASEVALPSLSERALYIYTSSTTGPPKAANVSHQRLMQWSYWFAGLMDIRPSDRLYDCLPMYHSIGGIVAPGAALVSGATLVLRERFSSRQFWHDMVSERCTVFQYIGELCRYLLTSPPDPDEQRHELRLACGNGLRAEIWQAFQARFQIPRILEYYASTEGSFSLYNCEGRVGSIGRIPAFLPHLLRVALIRVDPVSGEALRDASGRCQRVAPGEAGEAIGELGSDQRVRFEGYADRAASEQKILHDVFEADDSWYRSGDLMRQDQAGFFYFVDRLGDTFRWKGENVSTTEVAAAISTCTQVLEAAVYGVPIPGAEGRAGMAALVVEAGFDPQALHATLSASLPQYARPLLLRLVPHLAHTDTFKLDKRSLQQEGYDPAHVHDPLYIENRSTARYEPLDAELYARLCAGQLRL